jgi:hypothetical protein
MRRIVASLLSAVLMIAAGAFAAGEAVPVKPKAAKSIAFVIVGPVDSALKDRVVTFAKNNTALMIRLLPAMEVAGDTLDTMGVAASRAMGPQDAALVVLAAPSMDIPAHKVILSSSRVVVVNVKSLKPSGNDAEKWGRRVEREVMKGIGTLMGVPDCPNPQCAMFQHTTDDELDAKGRNYCPPCLSAVQRDAKGKGVGVDVNNSLAVP